MRFFNKYPYTDFHEMNLDWLLNKMRELEIEFDEFKVVNNITFSGQWDITKQYPAWTIVSDNNIGYVSIQPVPVGITLTNGAYWVEVIDYTAQIAGLQQRVIDIEDDIRDNIKPSIQHLDDRFTEFENLYYNKKVIIIADSYAGMTLFPSKFATLSGATVYENSVGGEGFLTGTGGNGYLHELEEHVAAMTSDERDQITDVMFIGGANDANRNISYPSNPIMANATACVTYARTNFVNAKIHFGFIGVCKDTSTYLENRTQTNMERCAYFYKDTAFLLGCNYINDIEYSSRWLTGITNVSDGLHPDQNVGNVIAQNLNNYFKGSHALTSLKKYPVGLSNKLVGNPTMLLTQHNNRASLTVTEAGGLFTGTIKGGSANSANRTKLFDFSDIYFNEAIHYTTYAYFNGDIYSIDIQFKGYTCSIVVGAGIHGTGWKDISISNQALTIPPFTIEFDPIVFA